MAEATISVVINTLNEAANIAHVVRAVRGWADDVVVVDMYSEDGTADIAREHGARVFDHERLPLVEPARELGVEMATGDWILILDADEIPHPGLAAELRRIAERDDPVDLVRIPRVDIMLGRAMRHGGTLLNKPRFFRRDKVRIGDLLHRGLNPRAGIRVRILPPRPELSLWHFSYMSVEAAVAKFNRYSTVEGRQHAERGARPSPFRMVMAMLAFLAARYVRRAGYRDGTAGLAVAMVRSFNRFLVEMKAWDEPQLEARRTRVAEAKEHLVGLNEKRFGAR